MQNHNLRPVRFGNTYDGVKISLPNVDAYNLAGAKIIMQLKLAPKKLAVATYRNDGDNPKIIITGAYTFEIIEHVVTIEPGTYRYDILIIFSTGVRKTYVGGTWEIPEVISEETI